MPFAPHLKSQHAGFDSGRCMGTSRAQPSKNQHPSVHSVSTTRRIKPHHRPTHFISFPVTLPTLTEALYANTFVSTLDPASLIAPENLHITAGVLSLPTPDDLQKATALFQDHCSTVTQHNHPLKVAIPHLDVMQQDPKKTHVLYARVCDISDDKPLAHLCESLRRVMMDHGYMSPENRPFKGAHDEESRLMPRRFWTPSKIMRGVRLD
ncbi:hypothetical protein [Absidia glauca]|uniref:A-kinase anchor protein 7-like phosphoesterase domain-containing protein n=1 Tax=Absidia glauca TaxID=4829 RepID=A0A168T5Z8_ABSGL|nr:hypothetical protein [Absidia glauca]